MLFIFFFVLLANQLSPSLLQEKPEPTLIDLGVKVHGSIKLSESMNYYKIIISEKIPDEDLMIMVKPRDKNSDPDLFISSVEKYPNSYSNSEKVCNAFGLDVCTVAAQNITNNSVFYIGVNCYTDCSYSIITEYSSEILLKLGQEAMIKFYKTVPQIAKFYIPKDDSIDQLIIYATLLNSQEVNQTFHLYINAGNEIPTSSVFDFISKEVWFEGKGVSISKSPNTNLPYSITKILATDSNYTILIEAGKDSMILLVAEAFPKIRPISLFNEVHDIVDYQRSQTYELTISDDELSMMKDDPLILELRVFSGDPDLYVHYDTLPNDLLNYQWYSNEDGNEAITISKKERDSYNATNKFYITVFGKYDSAYVLNAYYTSRNNDYLLFGETMTGSIINNEVVNYRLNIYGDGTAKITLDLISETGNVDLFIKQCKNLDKKECVITLADIRNRKENSQNSTTFFLYSNNYGGKDSISYGFNSTDCHIQIDTSDYGRINICTYQIAIYGNSTLTETSHYSLLAKHSQKHTLLLEGTPMRSSLEIKEKEYYKFHLYNDTNIDSISFVTDNIAGEIMVYVSKTERFPNNTINDFASYFELDTCKYFKNKTRDSQLTGTYYIAIEAFSAADYIITVILHHEKTEQEKNETLLQINYIKLTEGQPMKIAFNISTNTYYFKFKAIFNTTNQEKVFIHLRPIIGHFKAYIVSGNNTNNTDPSEKNYDYVINENYITINKSIDINKFKILIVVDTTYEVLKSYKFALFYTTSNSIVSLGYDTYFDYIKESESKFYMITYDSNEEDVSITKTIYTSNISAISLSVSLNDEILYPSHFQNTHYLSKDKQNGTISITREEISNFCPLKRHMAQTCRIYIGVYSTENQYYSLLITKKLLPVLLYDEVTTEIPSPRDNDYQRFYYFVPANSTITVFVDSLYMNLHAYVTILPLVSVNKNEWTYPNSSSFDYSYNSSYYIPSSIVLKKNYFKDRNCELVAYGCVLLLSVQREALDYFEMNNNINIVVSSHLTRLQEGKPFVSYVDKHTIKYFSIYVNQPDCVLLIAVTPIGDGDPDLVVSKGRDERPTLENYDWISTNYKSEQLQISRNSSAKVEKSMEGLYVIGIYGFTNCTFSLTVVFQANKIIFLRPGFPHELYLKSNETISFQYYNFDSAFRVIISTEFGDSALYINPYNSSKDFIDQLPCEGHHFWSSKSSNRDIAYVKESDNGFCAYCDYLISVVPKVNSKVNVIISNSYQPIQMQSGKVLNDYVEEGDCNTYLYQTTWDAVEFDFILFSGDIEIYVSRTEAVSVDNYLYKYNKSNLISNKLTLHLGMGFSLVSYNLTEHKENISEIYRHSILIKGLKNSNYSVSFTSKSQTKILRFGVADYTILKPIEHQQYMFYCLDSYIVNIMITVMNQNSSNFNNIQNIPNINIFYKINSTINEANIVKNITNLNSIFLQIKTNPGFYNMNITNIDLIESLTYSVLVNTNEVNLILSGSQQMMLLPIGEFDKYELYAPSKKKLFIEILECFGKVQLKGTQNYLNMKSGKYDWEFEYPYENNHIIAFYEVEQGPVFIGVQAVQGYQPLIENSTSLNEAFYIMKVHFLPPKGKIPQEKFFAGDGGNFNWKNSFMNNEIIINFGTVTCLNDCKEEVRFMPVQFVYYLHISADQYLLNSFSKCNINDDVYSLFKMSKSSSNKLYYERYIQVFSKEEQAKVGRFSIVLPKEIEGPFFVNIVSEVWVYDVEENLYEEFTIVYNSQEISKNIISEDNPNIKLFIIIGVAGALLLVVSIIIGCYYRKRTKKFEKRLKYELSDVRNVAASGEIFEGQKADKNDQVPLPYKGFLEEKAEGGA